MKRPPRPGEEIVTLLGSWTRFISASVQNEIVVARVVHHAGMNLVALPAAKYAQHRCWTPQRFKRCDEGVTWVRANDVEARAMIAAAVLRR